MRILVLETASAQKENQDLLLILLFLAQSVASYIVEKRRFEFTKRLLSADMTMADIKALDENHEGGGKC